MRLIRSVFTLAASLAAAALVLTAGLSALAAAPRTISLQELEQQVAGRPPGAGGGGRARAKPEPARDRAGHQRLEGLRRRGRRHDTRRRWTTARTRDYNRGSIRAGLRYPGRPPAKLEVCSDWLAWPKTLPPAAVTDAGGSPSPRGAVGVYLWESRPWIEGRAADWEALRRFGIVRLLVSLDAAQIKATATPTGAARLRGFLERAHGAGVSVDLLLGEPLWILPGHRQNLLRIIQQLRAVRLRRPAPRSRTRPAGREHLLPGVSGRPAAAHAASGRSGQRLAARHQHPPALFRPRHARAVPGMRPGADPRGGDRPDDLPLRPAGGRPPGGGDHGRKTPGSGSRWRSASSRFYRRPRAMPPGERPASPTAISVLRSRLQNEGLGSVLIQSWTHFEAMNP